MFICLDYSEWVNATRAIRLATVAVAMMGHQMSQSFAFGHLGKFGSTVYRV